MGLGWAAEAAPEGGLDAVSKLIEQRMQMARDAEMVRAHQANEAQAAAALKENTALRRDTFGAAQADRDISTAATMGKSYSPGDDVTAQAPFLAKGGQGPNMSAPAFAPMPGGGSGSGVPVPLGMPAPPAAAPPASLADPTQDQNAPLSAATSGGPYVPNAPALDSPAVTKRIAWLGTPAEREAKRKQDEAEAFVRGLPPGSDQNDAEYQLRMGHPRPPDRDEQERQRQADRQDNIRLAASLRTPPTADRTRLDHSYDTQTKRLDTLEKPLADQADRIAKLRATIAQNNPQSDALIAPELLIAMAGGQGTGLRINEAEIERVLGGKTKAEQFKSFLGSFSGDATKPFAVTPEQRKQMRDLIEVIANRGQQRLMLIDKARDDLRDATDVVGHRATIDHLKKALNADTVSAGPAAASGAGGNGKTIEYDANGKQIIK